MYLKKILTLFFIPSFFFLTAGCSNKKESLAFEENKPTTESIQNVAKKVSNIEKKCDLYTYSLYDLPLFSIIKIAKLSDFMKTSVDEILKESQGFYFLTNTEKGVLIILQNPIKMNDTYSRHDLQFVEILFNGEVLYHTAGYSGADGENLSDYKTDVDKWFYDNSSGVKKPIKHISYDENNKIKFIETWNYEETEPIKYEMVDSMKKTMSVLKVSQDDNYNLKKEHIFYDNEDKIVMSLTVSYDGANISRLIYYNAYNSLSNVSVISEYKDGLKSKEYIYNGDYELTNVVTSDYDEEGVRKNIKLFDSENNMLEEIST